MKNNQKLLKSISEREGEKVKGLEVSVDGHISGLTFSGQKWLSAEVYTEDNKKACFNGFVFVDIVFDTVTFSGIEFNNCKFINCHSRILTFCDIIFSDCSFEGCDFAGSSFFNTTMINVSSNDVDLACSFFETFTCSNSSFQATSLSASCFEDSNFTDNSYINTRMLSVEGLSAEQFSMLEKREGIDISYPVEIAFWNHLSLLLKKTPKWLKVIFIFILGFLCASNYASIKQGFFSLIMRDSSPVKPLFQFLCDSSQNDFFIDNFSLPNSGFENRMEHWLVIHDPAVINKGKLFTDFEKFRSFPASLACKGFHGSIFYSRERLPLPGAIDDVFNREDIWLPVRTELRSYKLSFYYLNAQPTITVYGRLKDGGMTLLAEIDNKQDDSANWIFYSEKIELNKNINYIAVKLSSFPDVLFNIDEVNVEKTL